MARQRLTRQRAPAARSCAPSRKLLNRQIATASTPSAANDLRRPHRHRPAERRELAAVAVDAAAHRQAQVARHQHLGEGRAMVPLVLAQAAADLERIAEALGRQHADLGALALEDACWWRPSSRARTARSRAAARVSGRSSSLGGEPQHAQHAFAGIGRHRRHLEDARRAPAASRSTRSVKVPPTSTPMRHGEVREGACESMWVELSGHSCYVLGRWGLERESAAWRSRNR